ncbi:MAG: DNA-binding response regulator [Hyphomicrobiales bacterium]|nr:MAG: DNA-binding response regulator [Hyphomicrobiales bacterium]
MAVNENQAVIYIVDDDPAVRDALAVVFEMEGFEVQAFATGDSFLEAANGRIPGCVLLDVHMPGRSGIDILKELNADHYAAPIFIISGQGDIPMAVNAIKQGAFDFIEKPFDAETVVNRLREAMAAVEQRIHNSEHLEDREFPGRETLTPRERQVLGQITAGASNKEAGRELGISPRTIEVHRARIMEKLGARNAADLVRIVMSADNL